MNSQNANSLASSIVLVCRPRAKNAGITDRRGFIAALKAYMPKALWELQEGNVAPVDLAQAAIGPGMAVFSRYAKVVEADGSAMPVRAALGLINQALDEVLTEQEGEFDADTRWAIAWFETKGFESGRYGEAEVLFKAKVTSQEALVKAGIISAAAGMVRLLRRDEIQAYPADQSRPSRWVLTLRMAAAIENKGEEEAARLLAQAGAASDSIRDLAYRLYVTAERKGWTGEAGAFNALVTAWPELKQLAAAEDNHSTQEAML